MAPRFFAISRAVLALTVALASTGCEDAGRWLRRVVGAAPRCEAPEVLPGSTPMPPALREAIAAAPVPGDAASARICNRLVLEPSTFAQRRALDAVDWRPWSKAAFDEAAAAGRPLVVFTGFADCDECSRLAAASFGDVVVAREINSSFVPVLVDRRARPDVDAYLSLAVQVLTGGGGWPAAVFLDEDGRPFEAFSWGAGRRPGGDVAALVTRTARRVNLGGSVEERAAATAEKMQARAGRDWSGDLPGAAATADALRAYLEASFDEEAGSFGTPPLFPRPPELDFLLALATGNRDEVALAMVARTAAAVLASPMLDGASGGLRRMALSAAWKDAADGPSLADSAAFARTLLDASVATGDEALAVAARKLLGFVRESLALEGGAFAASRDAEGLDAQVVADANAVAVSALARAASVTGDRSWLDAATAAAEVLRTGLVDDGFVRHALATDGTRSAEGYLSDQALVALAFLDLEAAGAGEKWFEAAREIADAMPASFEHEAGRGFFQTRASAEPLPLRLKPAFDLALPGGNPAAALLYVRLAARSGDASYAVVARRTLEAFSEVLVLRPLAVPTMVVALMEWEKLPPALRGPSMTVQLPAIAPPQLEPAPAVQP